VCKVMDYGRFKYLMERKQREAHRTGKAGRAASEMKDVQLSPRIDEHDMAFKVDRAHRFLQEGHPVRMVVRFLGRDMRHPEVGKQALDAALEQLGQLIPIQVDASPRMEGRQMVALVRLAKGAKLPEKKVERPAAAIDDEVPAANGTVSPDGRATTVVPNTESSVHTETSVPVAAAAAPAATEPEPALPAAT
jgi:translation initiation factor IF-3